MSSGSTPPDSGFIPRKEFAKDLRTLNTFCLLTLSGSSLIRLFSFPKAVVEALHRLFDQYRLIQAFREDLTLNFSEFTIDGKPWSNPKSVDSERMIIEVMNVLYQHGFEYLSTIDYGREADDRIAITFSKPSGRPETPHSRSASNGSPRLGGSGSSVPPPPMGQRRIPWALSFPSATSLRVICPPLHSTPAILQAVRGAWPRGVTAEKKIGDACYEFKLKGYGWFQEDTFATDSLHHILSLLSSLDKHAFTLLASISLSNRSRVKDLWVFTGPGVGPGKDSVHVGDSPTMLHTPESRRQILTPEPPLYTTSPTEFGSGGQHKRTATAPAQSSSPAPHHARSASDSAPRPTAAPAQLHTSNTLRKHRGNITPAQEFKEQVEQQQQNRRQEQQLQQSQQPQQHPQHPMVLPTVVPNGTTNMTGVGSNRDPHDGDVIYSTNGVQRNPTPPQPTPPPQQRETKGRATTPRPPSPPPKDRAPAQSDTIVAPAPLLGSNVFANRDSEFSSMSPSSEGDVKSCEIPITWAAAGAVAAAGGVAIAEDKPQPLPAIAESPKPKPRYLNHRVSTGPNLPGRWVQTPEDEDFPPFTDSPTEPATHDVDARVASPDLRHPSTEEKLERGMSQTGLVGVFQPTEKPPPVPTLKDKGKGKEKEGSSGSAGGWIMVNVEGKGGSATPKADSVSTVVPDARTPTPTITPQPTKTAEAEVPKPVDLKPVDTATANLASTSPPASPPAKPVEDVKAKPTDSAKPEEPETAPPTIEKDADTAKKSTPQPSPPTSPTPPVADPVSPSPTAKEIAAQDAIAAKASKSKSKDSSPSGFKKLFSRSKKTKLAPIPDDDVVPPSAGSSLQEPSTEDAHAENEDQPPARKRSTRAKLRRHSSDADGAK